MRGILVDGALTVLTVLPFGSGARAAISGGRFLPASIRLANNQIASGLRHLAVLGGMTFTSSLAMTAVEMSPIKDEYKGPLRFLAGLGAGLTSGIGLARSLPQIEFAVVRATRQYSAAMAKIARLEAANQAVPAALRQQAAKLEAQVTSLRKLGGQQLTDAEAAYKTAADKVAELEAKANAPGLAPSERAKLLKSSELQQARQAVKTANDSLVKVFAQVERVAGRELGAWPSATSSDIVPFDGAALTKQLTAELRDLVRRYPGTGVPLSATEIPERIVALRKLGTPEALAEASLLKSGRLSLDAPSLSIPTKESILYLLDKQQTQISKYVAQAIRDGKINLQFSESVTVTSSSGEPMFVEGLYNGGGNVELSLTWKGGPLRDVYHVTETVMHEARHYFDAVANTKWQEFRAFQWGRDGWNWSDPTVKARFGPPLTDDWIWSGIINKPIGGYSSLPLGWSAPQKLVQQLW